MTLCCLDSIVGILYQENFTGTAFILSHRDACTQVPAEFVASSFEFFSYLQMSPYCDVVRLYNEDDFDELFQTCRWRPTPDLVDRLLCTLKNYYGNPPGPGHSVDSFIMDDDPYIPRQVTATPTPPPPPWEP